MRVWVTRAEPEARRTAQALTALGHAPLVSPLLSVRPLPAGAALAQGLEGAGALAFTSANGVRAFAALRPLSERHLPAFTVGGATARAAREAGFVQVASAEGDSGALARAIAEQAAAFQGAVLYPGPRDPAADLIGALGQRGVRARAVAVYETLAQPPSPELLAALDSQPIGVDAALIHSGRAAQALAALLDDRPALARALAILAISRAAAEPLARFRFARRAIAAAPNETALLARLDR